MSDFRIYSRQALISSGLPEETVDSLERVHPVGSPSGRFHILPPGNLLPPACSLVSRKENDIWYIYLGTSNDEGTMYLGESDFHEMATLAGYVLASDVERLKKELEEARKAHVLALADNANLRKSIASLLHGVQPSIEVVSKEQPVVRPVDPPKVERSKPVIRKQSTFGPLDDLDGFIGGHDKAGSGKDAA